MNRDNGIYITHCGFCKQGQLQFMRCHSCTTVVAVCDECELIWLDISTVKDDPRIPAASAFPKCPACHSKQPYWSRLTRSEIERTSLSRFAAAPAARPESERPETAQPETAQPETAQPETAQRETERRETERRRRHRD